MNIFNGIKGEFTMDKMIDAYSKSDVFQKKYDKMIENKEEHIANIEAISSDIK